MYYLACTKEIVKVNENQSQVNILLIALPAVSDAFEELRLLAWATL